MILPKTWKHWCRDQRLKSAAGTDGLGAWLYLKGRGHHWRVTCNATLQIGDNYDDFDRWALCDVIELPIPKTREEFRQAIKQLLAAKKPHKGYYKGCKQIDQEADGEPYVHVKQLTMQTQLISPPSAVLVSKPFQDADGKIQWIDLYARSTCVLHLDD